MIEFKQYGQLREKISLIFQSPDDDLDRLQVNPQAVHITERVVIRLSSDLRTMIPLQRGQIASPGKPPLFGMSGLILVPMSQSLLESWIKLMATLRVTDSWKTVNLDPLFSCLKAGGWRDAMIIRSGLAAEPVSGKLIDGSQIELTSADDGEFFDFDVAVC